MGICLLICNMYCIVIAVGHNLSPKLDKQPKAQTGEQLRKTYKTEAHT